MSGNAKFRWFLLAPALLCFLSACASTGTLDNTSSTLQTNTSREVKLEGEERAKCEWEREPETPGEQFFVCIDYSREPRVQGYELCPPGWHDKFVAGVYSEGESRNKEQVRSGICVNNNTTDYVKNMIYEGVKFDQIDKAPTERQCKAGRGCRRALRCEQCRWDLENVYWADSHGEGASWYPCDMC